MRYADRCDPAEPRRPGQAGFTLIELITVVAVIAVLAAIAMQHYTVHRAAAFDARAMHDIGNAAVAQEAHYANVHSYATFSATGPAVLAVPGMVVSDTVTLKAEGTADSYSITSISSQGTGKLYTYDSETDTIRAD
jgi:type IV pilus assembly protein PilE